MGYAVWLWRHSGGIRGSVALRILVGLGQIVLGLLMVWLCRRFIDHDIYQGSVVCPASRLLAVLAGFILLRQLYYYMSSTATVRQQNALRQRLYRHLLQRRLFASGNQLHSGDISQRLDRDVSSVGAVLNEIVPGMAVTLFQLAGAFLLLRSMDEPLAWALLLVTPFLLACVKQIARRLRKMTRDIRDTESEVQVQVQETMEHEVTLRALESGSYLDRRLSVVHEKLMSLVLRRTRFTLVSRSLLAAVFGFGYLSAFIYGAVQLRDGVITFGVMTAFLQLVGQIQSPISSLMSMVPQLIHATASIDRLEELERMEVEEQVQKVSSLSGSAGAGLGIRMQSVSFSYPNTGVCVVQDFSHDFLPGSKTALVGRTGAGKTTLFRLMLGLAVPQEGSVSLYDTRGRQYADRLHPIVYVPQGNTLISGTIRQNLLLAKPEASDEELYAVLHLAAADFVASLPMRLDTKVGERGSVLSEGQAQRIAIARGLLRPGSVMLLDEISSALDLPTERLLFGRIFRAFPEKTVVLITHRMEVCDFCDEVIDVSQSQPR